MDTGDFEKLKKRIVLEEFSSKCRQSGTLFKLKNEDYGNAIDAGGVIGAVIEIIGIAARLMVMVLHSPDTGRSKRDEILDKLRDLHNYANIAMMMVDRDNWEGEIDWFQREMQEWQRKP